MFDCLPVSMPIRAWCTRWRATYVNDVTQAQAHRVEIDVFADSGYQGVAKREDMPDINVNWHAVMRRGKR